MAVSDEPDELSIHVQLRGEMSPETLGYLRSLATEAMADPLFRREPTVVVDNLVLNQLGFLSPEQAVVAQSTILQVCCDDVDSLSDLSTEDQLTLQQAMEQQGQFENVFSNVLELAAQTSAAIDENLKE